MRSDYARVDIKAGRKALEKRLRQGERVEVIIRGIIDTDPRSWNDDGASTEFAVISVDLEEVPNA